MPQPKPIITASRVEAYFASALRLLGWLLGAMLRGGWKGKGARLRHLLSRAELAVECILFLKAMVLYGPLPRPRAPHPRSTPPGFRRISTRGTLFFKRARVRAKKAGAIARVLALLYALARPERAVAYFLKRICKGLRLSRLVLAAPPADTLSRGFAYNVAFADSS